MYIIINLSVHFYKLNFRKTNILPVLQNTLKPILNQTMYENVDLTKTTLNFN